MTEPTVTLPPAEPRRRKIIPLVIAGAVVLVLIGGGAFAWSKLSGGGAQPADVLPASTIAYARVDLNPSASQKINAVRLLRKVPSLAKEVGITSDKDDLRRLIFEDLVEECQGINYDQDVKPWLGDRAGIGAVTSVDEPVLALEAKDRTKATAAAKKLATCEGEESSGVTYSNGYLLVGETQKGVEAIADEAAKKPLSKAAGFSADEKALGDRGIASVWIDLKAAQDLPELKERIAEIGAPLGDDVTSVTAALRAGSSSLHLAGVARTNLPAASRTAGITNLPADTALAAGYGLGNAGDSLDALQQSFEQQVGFSEAEVARFVEESTGLKYPADLRTILGSGITLAIGKDNLDRLPLLSGPGELSTLNAGIALHGDSAKTTDLLSRLADLAQQTIGLQLETSKTPDGAVIATNADTAQAFSASGEKLGSTATFRSVIEHASDSYAALFLDVSAIVDALQDSSPPPAVSQVLDELSELSAAGASAWDEDKGQVRFSVKVAFKD